MDDQEQQEKGKEDLVFFSNTHNDELNPHLAVYEILQQNGFNLVIDPDSERRVAQEDVSVFASSDDIPKIGRLTHLVTDSPEGNLFFWSFQCQPGIVKDMRNGSAWAQANDRLIDRALKLAYIRAAENHENTGGSPAVLLYREEAKVIKEPPLDPEGIRIVLEGKIRQFLEEHPDLRPDSK